MKVLKILAFTVSSLLLLIFGGAYLCMYDVLGNSNYYFFYTNNIYNLTKDSGIYINGKKIGNVSGIEFSYETHKSRISIRVDRRVKLLENSVVFIKGTDLTHKTLEIELNDGNILERGEEVMCIDKSLMTCDLLQNVNDVIINCNEITNNLKEITKNVKDETRKIIDENITGRMANLINKASDLLNNVRIPWLFRKNR